MAENYIKIDNDSNVVQEYLKRAGEVNKNIQFRNKFNIDKISSDIKLTEDDGTLLLELLS